MKLTGKRSRSEVVSEREEMDVATKAAAARASPWVVSVISHNVPDDMIKHCRGYKLRTVFGEKGEAVFWASGTIIECEKDSDSDRDDDDDDSTSFTSTVLAPASLFKRSNGVQPSEIQVDVYLSGGKLYKGQVLACDFHYNRAAITIQSDVQLPTATLRGIDDVVSICPNELYDDSKPKLRPHSKLFKLLPGAKIIALGRSFIRPYDLRVASGLFCAQCPSGFNCNELYRVQDMDYKGNDGGPITNCGGQVIGIMFNAPSFLSSNTILRWWDHYKKSREFRRPFVGMEVNNLHEASFDLMEQVIKRFPDVSTGVVVTKLKEDSPAYGCGICPEDVISKVDGKVIKSKLEFYDKIWEKAGQSVEFNVLRASNGQQLNLSMTIGEATQENLFQWQLPGWGRVG